jgi:hypothetical protein
MSSEDSDALARKAARDAIGKPLTDDDVEYFLHTHAGHRTEDLIDLLAAKTAEFDKAGRRPRHGRLAEEIETLKIVLAVRAAVPGVGVRDEIQLNARRWPTREAPTLTVSLDCLVEILTEKSDLINTAHVAKLMASLCLNASSAFEGDSQLAVREAQRYDPSFWEEEDTP